VTTFKLPGGFTVTTQGSQADADRMQKLLEARGAFAVAYCRQRGWPEDPALLSMQQIVEIRKQDGWKNPVVGGQS
jgi:hypothetical protein